MDNCCRFSGLPAHVLPVALSFSAPAGSSMSAASLLSAPNGLAFTERFCFLDPKHRYLRLFGQPQLPAARRKQVGSGDCGETLAHCFCPLPAPLSVRLDGESLAGTPISSNQGLVHTQLRTSGLSPFKISSGLESSGACSAPCPGSLAV